MNYEPFEFKNAFLDDERSLKFDPSRYEYYRQLLASYYWMDCWFDNQSLQSQVHVSESANLTKQKLSLDVNHY